MITLIITRSISTLATHPTATRVAPAIAQKLIKNSAYIKPMPRKLIIHSFKKGVCENNMNFQVAANQFSQKCLL